MTDTPLATVVMVNFNHGEFLEECLNSISAQTYKNLEVILADGGSTDNSLELAAKFRFVRVLPGPDGGAEKAMFKALGEARGDYIFCTTSTDGYICKTWFMDAISYLEEHQEPSLVWGGSANMTRASQLGLTIFPPESRRNETHFDAYFRWIQSESIMGAYFPELNYCVRRSVYLRCLDQHFSSLDGYDKISDPIYFFHFNFMALGYISKFLPILANFGREHPNKLTLTAQGKSVADHYHMALRAFKSNILDSKAPIHFKDSYGKIIKVANFTND